MSGLRAATGRWRTGMLAARRNRGDAKNQYPRSQSRADCSYCIVFPGLHLFPLPPYLRRIHF